MFQSTKPDWQIISVGLLLKEGKVLLGLRSSEKNKGGLWEFPGGSVELGEHPQTTVIRELKEELNIEVREPEIAGCLCDHKKETSLLIAFFYIKSWKGEIKKNDHQRLGWFSLEDCIKNKIPNINPLLFNQIIDIISKKINSRYT